LLIIKIVDAIKGFISFSFFSIESN